MKKIGSSFLMVLAIVGMLCTGAWAQTKSAPAEDEKQTSAKVRTEYLPETIEKAQQALKSKGLYKGEATGKMDAATKEAIKAFQTQAGINSTGHLNKDTRQKLGIEAATETEKKPATKKTKKTKEEKPDAAEKK